MNTGLPKPQSIMDQTISGNIKYLVRFSGEIPGENLENKVRLSNRNIKKPNRYGTVPYTGNFWG